MILLIWRGNARGYAMLRRGGARWMAWIGAFFKCGWLYITYTYVRTRVISHNRKKSCRKIYAICKIGPEIFCFNDYMSRTHTVLLKLARGLQPEFNAACNTRLA